MGTKEIQIGRSQVTEITDRVEHKKIYTLIKPTKKGVYKKTG